MIGAISCSTNQKEHVYALMQNYCTETNPALKRLALAEVRSVLPTWPGYCTGDQYRFLNEDIGQD